MKKKVLSLVLAVIMLAAFSVPALATQSLGVVEHNNNSVVNGGSVHTGNVPRTFSVSQDIPASINHTVVVGINIYWGPIPRTGLITNNFVNGVLVSHSTVYSGMVHFVGTNA